MWSQDRVLYICTHMDHETAANKLVMELKPGVEWECDNTHSSGQQHQNVM